MELLPRFLQAATPGEADRLLEELLESVARPLISRVVRSRLGFAASRADLDDACAESVFEVLARLRQAQAGGPPIANFQAYTAGIAFRVASEIFSNRFPERKRLRFRLRYALTSDPQLRLWEAPGGRWLCALRGVDGAPASPAALNACFEGLAGMPSPKLSELVPRILQRVGAPLELNDLTSLVSRLTGVVERVVSEDVDPDLLVAVQATPAQRFELLDWVRAVWREVGELPGPQRVALVLGMRAAEGAAAWLITDLGIATFRELAAAVGMDARDLAAIWNRLPLDDREIADRLALERQQVINLRSAARKRLARRMGSL